MATSQPHIFSLLIKRIISMEIEAKRKTDFHFDFKEEMDSVLEVQALANSEDNIKQMDN
jgi:hypothetical protein